MDINDPIFRFIDKGDSRLLLDEVREIRAKAEKLVNEHKGGAFSWPLDAYGERIGYWLHVGILQAWHRDLEPYAVHALKWLADDANILLCMLAVERHVRADVLATVSGAGR